MFVTKLKYTIMFYCCFIGQINSNTQIPATGLSNVDAIWDYLKG